MQTFAQLLTTTETPEQRLTLLEVFVRACKAVGELHARGVVHAALAPSLLSCQEDKIEILAAGTADEQTAYRAPEQLREETADARADLYSLGVILYELITGHLPFEKANSVALVLAILTEAPLPPSRLWPACPAPLEALCLSLLSKEKKHRPKNIDEVLQRLKAGAEWEQAGGLQPTKVGVPNVAPGFIPGLDTGRGRPREEASAPIHAQSRPSGAYEIKEEIGRGGAGRILRAVDRRIGREIALKESLSTAPIALERFVREALITARLEHPAIVPIHETGNWPDGSPFYTMKLIQGRPLSEVLEGKTFSERVALLPRVFPAAEAIAYAHSKGVIHRDLKPQNILLGGYGETVVIDWGLAKEARTVASSQESGVRAEKAENNPLRTLEPAEAGFVSADSPTVQGREPSTVQGREPSTVQGRDIGANGIQSGIMGEPGLTKFGTILGTPAYMPLEQAEGKEVDARADVYSLGAILYHLLSGVPPYDTSEFTADAVALIRKQAPPLIEVLEPETPKDLAALVNKAMSRDPSGRYANAEGLCRDLDLFLQGGLVSAHRYSPGEMMWRSFRRYRAAFLVAAASLLTLSALGAYSVSQIIESKNNAERSAVLAKKNEEKANEATYVAVERLEQLALAQARALVERSPLKALGALKILTPGSPYWRAARIRAADIMQRGTPQVLYGETGKVSSTCAIRGHLVVSAEENNTLRLWDTKTQEIKVLSREHPVNMVACSLDGRYIAASGRDHAVRLFDLDRNEWRFLYQAEGAVLDLNFSGDTRLLASADQAGAVHLFDVESGAKRLLMKHTNMMRFVRFSPDQKTIAAVGNAPSLYLFDVETGTKQELDNPGDLQRVRFSPDGKWIATASYHKGITLWDIETKTKTILEGHIGEVWNLAFSPDSKTLASVGQEKRLWIWDLKGGERGASPTATRSPLSIALDGEGTEGKGSAPEPAKAGASIPSPGLQSGVHGIDPGVHGLIPGTPFEGHQSSIRGIAFSSDGALLATTSMDRSVRVWNTSTWESRVFEGHEDVVYSPHFFPGDKQLLTYSWDGTARVWELDNGGRSFVTSTRLTQAELSPDGQWVVTIFDNAHCQLTNIQTGEVRRFSEEGLSFELKVRFLFSPDSKRLLSIVDTEMYLWDLEGKLLKKQLNQARGRLYQAVFTQDGKWLAVASASGRTTIWNTESDVAFELTTPQGSSLGGVALSPDGKWLATIGSEPLGSSVSPKTLLWPVSCFTTQACEPIATFENPPGANERPVFSPDGKLLTISNGDLHSIVVIDLDKKTMTRLAPHGTYNALQFFSPDSARMATVGLDTAIRLWDTTTWTFRELRGHQNFVQAVAFSRDGQSLVSGGYDQTIRIWDVVSGEYRVLTAPDRLVHRVYYSPDNERVISIADSGVIRVWLDNLPNQEDAFWEWLAKTPTPK